MSAPGPIRGTTGKDEWGTPQYIFDYWNQTYDFQVDAAASANNSLCGNAHYNKEYNSLANHWRLASRFWLNPPYGGGSMLAWVERCIEENQQRNATIVSLLPNNTDMQWFKRAFATASRISFLEGRISFIDPVTRKPMGGNVGGSVFVAWHPSPYRSVLQVEHIRIPKPKA